MTGSWLAISRASSSTSGARGCARRRLTLRLPRSPIAAVRVAGLQIAIERVAMAHRSSEQIAQARLG
jgi:hypothetical protein